MKQFLLPTLTLLLLTQCQKEKADPDPASQLPPATQTGANTFGCLVNGQAWTPKGNSGYANYDVVYDPTYSQGTLSVAASRFTGNGADNQIVGFSSDSLRTVGTYKLRTGGRHQGDFNNRLTSCIYHSVDKGTYCKGSFTITRLDYKVGVVSGTFSFTLAKAGCDTVKITQGRFDKKL